MRIRHLTFLNKLVLTTFQAFCFLVVLEGQQITSVISPEINKANSITFRFFDPEAREVLLTGDCALRSHYTEPMQKDDLGLWTITIGPLTPDLYSYSFLVDGIRILDQDNGWIKPGVRITENMFLLPGKEAEFLMESNVPHGDVRIINYFSTVLNKVKRMHIYFPPGYESDHEIYPVLYLTHAGGDNDDVWTSVGRVNYIMDNLIAADKAKPMIIVMPSSWTLETPVPEDRKQENSDLFSETLIKDIIPYTEQHYRVLNGCENRAIGGISNPNILEDAFFANMDKFNYVGFFSNKHSRERFEYYLNNWGKRINDKENLKRIKVWIGEGVNAPAYEGALYFSEVMKDLGYNTTFYETNGIHGWPFFRRYFAEFVTQIFE